MDGQIDAWMEGGRQRVRDGWMDGGMDELTDG